MSGPAPHSVPIEARLRPAGELILVTMALNVLGLSVPIAAAQIFDRVIPNPGTATLSLLALGVLVLGGIEALLRYGRAAMLTRVGANFAGAMTHRVLTQVVLSEPRSDGTSPSKSLEYLSAIGQLKEKYNGQILVSLVELLFLPMMVAVIFAISWVAGLLVLAALGIFALVTLRAATQMKRLANAAKAQSEGRYTFLFTMLSAMHAIKALGIEDNILRRYEAVQEDITRANHGLALVTGQLLNAGPVASQLLVALVLAFGALGVAEGDMTMGGVSALVIIASRVMAPVQRAVLVFVQMKDIGAAEACIEAVLAQPPIATPVAGLRAANEGRVALDAVSVERDGRPLFDGASLTIAPGEVVALSGTNARANSALLQVMAGIIRPSAGEVRLNGLTPTQVPQAELNRFVGYVPSNGTMFRGTIRDNVTRFGEVDVEAALEVAEILEIDGHLKELPKGLDTELLGGATETIPPGLVQQLSLLRALATRPRLILLDNADRGLDQAGYAKLNRFVGKIHGQASFVIVSDDVNLMAYASRRFTLTADGLARTEGFEMRERTAYRDLKL